MIMPSNIVGAGHIGFPTTVFSSRHCSGCLFITSKRPNMEHAQAIDRDKIEHVKTTAKLVDVIGDFVALRKEGISYVGECPHCHAKKFTVTETTNKHVYKCFSGCGKAGQDALKFMQDVMGRDFLDSVRYLADRYNISLDKEITSAPRNLTNKNRQEKFRDVQLRASGISDKYQKYFMRRDASSQVEADRYQAATIDKGWNIISGDDMVLHYIGLDWEPIMFTDSVSKKTKPLIRVRWSNPDLHLSKDGTPMKYQSPYRSGSHMWLPNALIKLYEQHGIFETLYVTEGEKKADAMCLAGLPTVGIMGIHNLSDETTMPHQFELIVKRCGVRRVVLVLDSDWQDISLKPGKAVDSRPNGFFKAVWRFREYFYGYVRGGINMRIYFAHGKDPVHKGMDDVLVRALQGQPEKLGEDFNAAMALKSGEGQLVNCYDITERSSYQIKEFWHLHSTPSFLNAYGEQLKKLPEFTLAGLTRRWSDEKQEFELAQAILPHEQYWQEEVTEDRMGRERKQVKFSYQNWLNFMRNRGYGLYEYKPMHYRFIHMNEKVVHETAPISIRHYMIDFTREIDEPQVLEMLLRGGKQFFGPDNLHNLPKLDLNWSKSDKDCMYFYFKKTYWKITADTMEEYPLSDLPAYVWKDQTRDFEPKLIGSMMRLDRDGDRWVMGDTSAAAQAAMAKSDIARFYFCTSHFHWRKQQELYTDPEGKKFWIEKENPEKATTDETQFFLANLASKIVAAGYVAHDYINHAVMKAIVCMDGAESEVGRSQGGTGKSIWGKQFEHLLPMVIIDGKRKNIEDDNHLYEEVDERTKVMMFDDVKVNFNFEFLFSQITTGLSVNPKGEKRYKVDPPKFILATNHALNGDGNSFERRQYTLSFSDYFNGHRTVGDEFGRQLFHEWDWEQWNLFYNWMATCVQNYLRHGLQYSIPGNMLERRKLRQDIGENFLSWSGLVFDQSSAESGDWMGIFLNKKIEKGYLLEKYLEQYPRDRRYMDATKMKDKVKKYCEYVGLEFNPTTNGERLKSDGREYFILADNRWDAAYAKCPINCDDDQVKWRREMSNLLPSGKTPFDV